MRKPKIIVCAVIVLTLVLISASYFAPAVEAASENETETVVNTNAYVDDTDSDLAKDRAIAIDEAKSEAMSAVKVELEAIAKAEAEELAKAKETFEANNEEESTYIASSNSGSGEYLFDIENPDPNYAAYSFSLSDYDRDCAERIVMGEAGSQGYEGMALVAQCVRDAYASGKYSSIQDVINSCGYEGSMSIEPSQTCKDAVRFIFDEGGAAVQHRLLVFYASDICSSAWHETQNFIVEWGAERFFDMW